METLPSNGSTLSFFLFGRVLSEKLELEASMLPIWRVAVALAPLITCATAFAPSATWPSSAQRISGASHVRAGGMRGLRSTDNILVLDHLNINHEKVACWWRLCARSDSRAVSTLTCH